jgi:branched-chain amino acid transport system substrate-binding protein
MQISRFKLRVGIVAALLSLGVAGCNTNSAPAPIVIGHVSDKARVDKAGDQAELGIRLALSNLNKADALTEALAGRPVQVRHTDAHGDLDAFESQAVRLDTVNRCLAILGGNSAKEVAALDHVKVPILTFYGMPVSGASNQVFYLGMSPVRQGEALARVVADEPKTKKVVIIVDERRPESAATADGFQKAFADARKDDKAAIGATVVVRFGKDADWNDLMDRTRQQEPQAVVFAGAVAEFNAYHKAFRREYFVNEPTLVFAGSDGDQRRIEIAPATKATILLASALNPESDKTAGFLKAFQDAFQTDADVNAALAYDGFRMLAEALKKTTPQLTPEHLRDEFAKVKDFDGVTGPLSITSDRQTERPTHVLRWQNGAVTLVKTIGP